MLETVDAILMASGDSARFGEADKLLAPFRGAPLLAHTIRLALGLGCFGSIFLVCASREVARLAEGLPVRVLDNRAPGRGMCESVRLGVEASGAEHYLFFPCDQPFLEKATVEAILAAGAPGRIVVPEYRGVPGNPTLFSAWFRGELLTLPDGEAPRRLKKRHPQAVDTVAVASPWPLRDIDTPEDLRYCEENGPPIQG